MTADMRGFHFPLEALRRKREWELEQARHALAAANREVARLDESIDAVAIRFAAARADWSRRFGSAGSIDANARQIADSYFGELDRVLKAARHARRQAQESRARAMEALRAAQHAFEAVDAVRGEALAAHRVDADRRDIAEADDAWMRRRPA